MRRTADQIADELLVLGSQAGDTTAWRRLVERWQPKLFAQALRLAGTREGAADITQESWLAIVRSLRRLDDPARFRFWARRIVANKSADWVRQQQRQRKLMETATQQAATWRGVGRRAGTAGAGGIGAACYPPAASRATQTAGHVLHRRQVHQADCRLAGHTPRHRQSHDCTASAEN